jgi:hypothetical protein
MRKEMRSFCQKFHIACIFSIMLIIITGFVGSLAQTINAKDGETYKETLNDILEKQTQLKKEIKAIETVSNIEVEKTTQITPSLLEKKSEILQQIDLIYEQQHLQVKQSLDINETIKQLQNELADLVIQAKWLIEQGVALKGV